MSVNTVSSAPVHSDMFFDHNDYSVLKNNGIVCVIEARRSDSVFCRWFGKKSRERRRNEEYAQYSVII